MEKKTYLKVNFRIDSGYLWGKGLDRDKIKAFEEEIKSVLEPMGFVEKEKIVSCAAPEYIKGLERLYCHPMELTGVIIEEDIPVIKEAIQKAKTWKLLNVETSFHVCSTPLVPL